MHDVPARRGERCFFKKQIRVKFLLTGTLVSSSFCLPAAVPVNDTLITRELPWSAVGEADKEVTVKLSRPPLLSVTP